MPRGVILVDYTDQGRRTIKDSPDRAEASKARGGETGRSGQRHLLYARRTA